MNLCKYQTLELNQIRLTPGVSQLASFIFQKENYDMSAFVIEKFDLCYQKPLLKAGHKSSISYLKEIHLTLGFLKKKKKKEVCLNRK